MIDLGREIMERGIRQIEYTHDNIYLFGQLTSTLTIVAEAIKPSSTTDADQLLFVINSFLQDDYEVCSPFSPVLDRKYPDTVWAEVAEKLKQQLPAQVESGKDPSATDSSSRYHRKRLSGWIITALQRSGNDDAATEFCIEEATNGGSYQRAVDHLIALKRYDDARELALKGLESTALRDKAGSIRGLQDSLGKIAAKSKDYSVAVAIAAERFVAHPGVSSFQELKKAAKKAKCEDATSTVAMNFLETGKSPSFADPSRKPARKAKKVAGKAVKLRIDCWPFPAPPRATASDSPSHRVRPREASPHFDVLVQLAIQQRDPEAVAQMVRPQARDAAAETNLAHQS